MNLWINTLDSPHHLEKIENSPENDAAMTHRRRSLAAQLLLTRAAASDSPAPGHSKAPEPQNTQSCGPGACALSSDVDLFHQLIVRDGRRIERQRNHEGSTATIGLFNVNPALMLFNNRSHNGQTQTRTASLTRT